jgi:hypothetical protein
MTKAEIIRSNPGLTRRALAALAGTTPSYVATVRAKDRRPEHYAEVRRIRDRARPKAGIPGGKWNSNHDAELIGRRIKGESFLEIARALGCSRNAVAGRVTRLREIGLLPPSDCDAMSARVAPTEHLEVRP